MNHQNAFGSPKFGLTCARFEGDGILQFKNRICRSTLTSYHTSVITWNTVVSKSEFLVEISIIDLLIYRSPKSNGWDNRSLLGRVRRSRRDVGCSKVMACSYWWTHFNRFKSETNKIKSFSLPFKCHCFKIRFIKSL